jgi:hypothetical protein
VTSLLSTTDGLLPGYRIEPDTGAWLSLPWPDDVTTLPPSLGPQIIAWARQWLVHHLTGEPWEFTRGQRRFLHLWYALGPDGRWCYRSGVKRGSKGTGKDPFAAAIALAELCGPVRFTGWTPDGQPIGAPHRLSLVQIAANSEAQAKDVLRVANAMLSDDLRDEEGIDAGETRTICGRGRLEILTSSEKSAEGDPATAIILNESHHMTEASGGQRVAAVARRNAGKSPGGQARLLELTNAHVVGGESVAEDSYLAWQAQVGGTTKRVDILYDSREAPPGVDLADDEALAAALAGAYADSPWTDLERIRDEVFDPRTTPADSVRFYLNSLAGRPNGWTDAAIFDTLGHPESVVVDGDELALFLDCSKSLDATGLVAARISDGHVLTLGCWQRPRGDRGRGWLVPRGDVDTAVRETFGRYRVVAFYVDPSPAADDESGENYWSSLLDEWHRDYRDSLAIWATPGAGGHAVSFDMRLSKPGGVERNRRFTEAAERTANDIDVERSLTHDGDARLRRHVHNAVERPNQWGVSLGKESAGSSSKVDLAVCMVGARLARRDYLLSGKAAKKKRSGKVW